jgi:hypothetical protein
LARFRKPEERFDVEMAEEKVWETTPQNKDSNRRIGFDDGYHASQLTKKLTSENIDRRIRDDHLQRAGTLLKPGNPHGWSTDLPRIHKDQ